MWPHIDIEVIIFLIMVASILGFGIPQILKTQRMPRELQFELVPEERLNDNQRQFFFDYDQKMQSIGYGPAYTFTVPNLQGKNLSRTYLRGGDHAAAIVTALTAENDEIVTAQHYVEFATEMQDGSAVNTRNVQMDSVFASVPNRVHQDFREIKDPAELKRRHDRYVEKVKHSSFIFPTRENLLPKAQESHRRFVDHQVKAGYLKPGPTPDFHLVTLKTALRGVANFFNPFADYFTWSRLGLAILAAVILPVAVGILMPQITERIHESVGLAPDWSAIGVRAATYAFAGAAVGYLFPSKTFVWAFVIAFLPVKLLGVGASWQFVYSLLMMFVGNMASARRNEKERVV